MTRCSRTSRSRSRWSRQTPESTLAACAPFLDDPRFRTVVNPEVLDYAGNVRALLGRVRTPFFVPLSHDDLWHPSYLERLLAVLHARPDAVCAYPDMLCFGRGASYSGVTVQEVDDSGLPGRILSWFLDGASGLPWRGVTRAEVLDHDYPINAFRGFAVECEWTLHLLTRGSVLRIPEPLYLKRLFDTVDNVSASWSVAEQDLPGALEHHRERLLAAIPHDLRPEDHHAITIAAEAAMLRRWQEFSGGRWGLPARFLDAAAGLLVAAERLRPTTAARVTATVRWALSRHWQIVGDLEAAEQEARAGLVAAPDDPLLCTQLGWLLSGRDAILEATELGLRASRAHPDDPRVRVFLRDCERRLAASLQPLSGPSDGSIGQGDTSMERPGPAGVGRLPVVAADLDHIRERLEALTAEVQGLRSAIALIGSSPATEAPGAQRHGPARQQPVWDRGRRALLRVRLRAGLPNPLFDAAWYRGTYPDVPRNRALAWLHWRRHGWREGRDPSPTFDTGWYLASYPDVRAAGVDPLGHYLLHGSGEGRISTPHPGVRGGDQ